MELFLKRRYHSQGCNGILLNQEQIKICETIELPWRGNKPNISCIPEGRYRLEKRYSFKFKWHIHLVNVPNRSLILIHPANDALTELKGCIAPVIYCNGIGKGMFSVRAYMILRFMVFTELEKGNAVYITISSE